MIRTEGDGPTDPVGSTATPPPTDETMPMSTIWAVALIVTGALALTSLYSYLLFHTLAELVSIIVSMMLASLAWQTYRFARRGYSVFLGAGFAWVAVLDLAHTVSYKGMGIIAAGGANAATQFWIAGRFLEAAVLLTATALIGRGARPSRVFALFSFLALALLSSILIGVFPTAYVDGVGMTPFKIGGEYVVIAVMALTLYLLFLRRDRLGPLVFPPMAWAIALMICAELAFILYVDVFGLLNLTGHIFRTLSKWMIYIGVVRLVLITPYLGLERAVSEKARAERDMRESRERFRNLIENTSDFVWETDLDFTYTYASPKVRDLLGYDPSEVVGQTIYYFMPSEEARRIERIARSILAEKRPFSTLRNVQRHRDWHEVTLETSGVPIFLPDGSLKGYRGISRDVSERIERDRKLRLANTLIEGSPTVLFRWRNAPGWPVDYVSDNVSQFGVSADDLLSGRVPYASIVHPDDLARVGEEVARHSAAGAVHFTQEYRLIAADGSVHWIDDRTTVERDETGAIIFYQGIVIDVTERREAEDALRESERKLAIKNDINQVFLTTGSEDLYARFLERILLPALHSPHGAFGYIDADGNLVLPSLTAEMWEDCHIPGKSPVFPESAWGESSWGRAIRGGRSVWSNETSTRTPTGHIVIDRHIATPIVFGDATVGLLMVANREEDYTEHDVARLEDIAAHIAPVLQARLRGIWEEEARRKAEEKQRAQEAEMRLLVESSGEGIFAVDADGLCTIINPAALRMLGLTTTSEIVGRNPCEVFHLRPGEEKTFYAPHDCPTERVLSSGRALRLEAETFLRADGGRFTVYYHAYPMKRGNEIVGTMVLFRDITEEMEIRRRARIAERMETLGHLAGGVAHDLNNMLLPIINLTQMAMKDLPEQDRNRVRLSKVMEASARAKRLVADVLAFSRQDAAEPQPLDICVAMGGIIRLLRETIPTTITIHADLNPATGIVHAAPSQIDTILMNLSVNASQAIGPQTGHIDIALDRVTLTAADAERIGHIRPGVYARLSVADDGPGIPPDILDKIFDPFFTTKEVGTGTGLGLSVIFGAVTKLGGAITVDTRLGEGATFTIYLPVVEAEAGATAINSDSQNGQ